MDLKIDLRHRWRDALARHRLVALVEPRDVAAVLVGVVVEEDGSGGFWVLAYASPVEPRVELVIRINSRSRDASFAFTASAFLSFTYFWTMV